MTLLAEIRYGVRGRPVSWKRPSGAPNRARRYTPKPMREAKGSHALLATAARQTWQRDARATWPRTAKYSVIVTSYLPTAVRVDVDNLAKLVLDSLNHVLWEDDAQVIELRTRKLLDRERPRTIVHVRVLEPEEIARIAREAIEADAAAVAAGLMDPW